MNLTSGQAIEELHYRSTPETMHTVFDLFTAGHSPAQVKAKLGQQLQHNPAALRGQSRAVDECYQVFSANIPQLQAKLSGIQAQLSNVQSQLTKLQRIHPT
jgi:hypothetical protein